MATNLTAEQREQGKANFHRTVGELALESQNDKGPSRRQFMKGMIAAGIAAPIGAAAYFGYSQAKDVIGKNPVKAALIGAGNQGNALVHHHNPQYLQFVAVHDIRPTNQKRIFTGFGSTNGFNKIYGGGAKDIKVYEDEGYKEILARKDIEAIVIALPLHLHAPVAIECMKAGKHVLCEKLMAHTVGQCKEMIKVAKETDRCLAIGHQRHYSMMYAHAVEVLNSGVLGDVRCIRANWHRNFTWPQVDPKTGKPIPGKLRDGWKPKIAEDDEKKAPFKAFGYNSVEELVQWRLFNRTGAGLMAELGSHQLDACSIFLGKVHPLAVSGVGGKFFYKDDREIDDHIFVNFEFPGPNNLKDKNDVVVVTYSSINTNQFEPYGECVMGTRGTMLVEAEREIMLFAERDPNKTRPKGSARSTSVTVAKTGAGAAVLDSAASEMGAEQIGEKSMGAPPPSRGYKEEMEHFAYCIRLWDESPKIRPWDKNPGKEQDAERKRRLPRCHGQVAMADAVIALTANVAMKTKQRIEFRPEWFDFESDQAPETLLPKDDKLA